MSLKRFPYVGRVFLGCERVRFPFILHGSKVVTGRSRNKLDDLQAGAADAAINLRTKNPYKWPKIDGYAWGENFTPPH